MVFFLVPGSISILIRKALFSRCFSPEKKLCNNPLLLSFFSAEKKCCSVEFNFFLKKETHQCIAKLLFTQLFEVTQKKEGKKVEKQSQELSSANIRIVTNCSSAPREEVFCHIPSSTFSPYVRNQTIKKRQDFFKKRSKMAVVKASLQYFLGCFGFLS